MSPLDPLRTARLVGHPLGPEHLEDLLSLSGDQQVMSTMGVGVMSAEQTEAMLAREIEHWEEHGFGLWAFHLREEASRPHFVGRAGLRRVRIEGVEEVAMNYVLRAEHWGRGLATEIARALCDVAFGVLGLRDLVANALPTNLASRRVMEKAGFRYEREIERHGLTQVLYRRRRPAPGSRDAMAA